MEAARCPQHEGEMSTPTAAPALSQEAFRALYREELPSVWSFLRRMGARGAELEDLSQEVFVKVYRSYPRYDPSRPLRPWLLGIAFRVAADFLRLAYHQRESLQEPPEVADEAELDRRLLAEEAKAQVDRALNALEVERRAILVLHDLEGQTVPSIAEAMGAPLATTYSRLRLARAQFTAALRRELAKEGGA